MPQYETWVEINVNQLQNNLQIIKQRIPVNTEIIAVIKGNAYGHDAILIANTLNSQGINRFAVATINEGIALRKAGLENCKIHILGSMHPDCAERSLRYDFINTICTLESAQALVQYKRNPVVHVNIDLGMNRVGCDPNFLQEFLKQIENLGVKVEGLFGHLPDVLDDAEDTDRQIQLFRDLTDLYQNRYLRHLSNTPALFRDRGNQCLSAFDYVRIGSALYGNIRRGFHPDADRLQRLLRWKVKPTHIHRVYKGEGIGYSSVYIATEDCWIATLPVGYVDGIPFQLSSHLKGGKIKMGNTCCNIVGKICMDHLMVKIPDRIPLDTEFELITPNEDDYLGTQNLALQCETTTTDIISGIHTRVKRILV